MFVSVWSGSRDQHQRAWFAGLDSRHIAPRQSLLRGSSSGFFPKYICVTLSAPLQLQSIALQISHMAPELLRFGKASAAADVYSMGIMMWEVSKCAGRTPRLVPVCTTQSATQRLGPTGAPHPSTPACTCLLPLRLSCPAAADGSGGVQGLAVGGNPGACRAWRPARPATSS